MTRPAITAAILISWLASPAAAQSPRQRRPPQSPPPAIEMAPAAAQMAILAAEDSRLPLPDDLHTPAIDTLRAKQMEDLRVLLELTRSRIQTTQIKAIRALGRLERREVVPQLLLHLPSLTVETANAVAQAFRGAPLPNDPGGQQVEEALNAMILAGAIPSDPTQRPGPIGPVSVAVGRLPYERADQVQAAESYMLSLLRAADSDILLRPALPEITRGVELLARQRARLALPSSDTIDQLRALVINRRHEYPPQARVNAMEALVAARGVDAETLRVAASAASARDESTLAQLRRLATVSLGGAGAPVEPTERTEMLAGLLADSSPIVRIEAVRAWARQESRINGCQRLLDALKDPSRPVSLAAMDALGESCKDDVNVTDRLTVEARVPRPDDWHRESHALVSLAKRSPGRAFIPLLAGHVQHVTWQVRMYAARAAAITDEQSALERLAYDVADNVREASLAPLRRLKGDEAEPYFVAALGRNDYQLLLTAANELKGAKLTPQIAAGLLDALLRVTGDRKETSRDTRLALLERLGELGDPDQAGALVPLLRDFDIRVAQAAAALVQRWTGKPQEIDPQLLPRPALPTPAELATQPARLKLKSGKILYMRLSADLAPLTVARFVRLARAGYYNGLSFHRVAPNFVVQGGSPAANEYAGDDLFMRDEISPASHRRGTVGLSTRGRDTGDAQIFVNLVDNPRLDFEYTVFGTIAPMDGVDEIVEGDTITAITFEKEEDKAYPEVAAHQ
jgi:cyclophilin family peptidyl-prolyl cis-trans isomerase/HEAT repeat protein